jgi:hypothetical protein
VNFIAHVQVALSAAGPRPDEADVAFGAALPDLASVAALRFDRSALSGAIREGVVIHHKTDEAFHSLHEFTTGVGDLRDQLLARGLAAGPSRAVGHAGWELLLDGSLLDRAGVEQGFARVLERAPDLAGVVSPADADRWRGLIAGMRADRWWLGYRDPEIVAQRLQRLLRARRRLSFSTEETPIVAEALTSVKPSVETAADSVMAEVIARLARHPSSG